MANVNDVKTLFALLYPNIPVVMANSEAVNETEMDLIPEWRGVKGILLTVENKILHGLRTTYPLAQPFNEAGVLQSLIDAPAVTQ
jgi:hypothetical protein